MPQFGQQWQEFTMSLCLMAQGLYIHKYASYPKMPLCLIPILFHQLVVHSTLDSNFYPVLQHRLNSCYKFFRLYLPPSILFCMRLDFGLVMRQPVTNGCSLCLFLVSFLLLTLSYLSGYDVSSYYEDCPLLYTCHKVQSKVHFSSFKQEEQVDPYIALVNIGRSALVGSLRCSVFLQYSLQLGETDYTSFLMDRKFTLRRTHNILDDD